MKLCLHPRCPVLVQHGRCPEHQRPAKPPEYTTRRLPTARWEPLRNRFVDESYPWFCAIQGERCEVKDNALMERHQVQVDHIVPHNGPNDPKAWDVGNLQILCPRCHSQKTAKDVGWARWKGDGR